MKFEYGSKSQEYDASGTASATKVMLVNSDGASVPIFYLLIRLTCLTLNY